MCEAITKQVLFSQACYFIGSSLSSEVATHFMSWNGISGMSPDGIFVEVRRIDRDVILEIYIRVEGKDEVHINKWIGGWEADWKYIRQGVDEFDKAFKSHPMNWKSTTKEVTS